jgi:hypothetical protein
MATTTSVTTTYAGEFAGKYVSAALLSADTIEGGGVTIKPNVKFKEVLKTINLDAITKDATCDFSDTSTLTLAESVLEVKQLQVNLELCKSDFEDDWMAIEMGYSAFDSLPASFADYLIGYVASKVAAKNESNIWQGSSASAGEFDGFTTLAAANADVIDVVGTTITAANVIEELGKVVDAIPAALYGKEDLYIYVSQHIARSYVRALGGFGANGLGGNGVNNAGTTWYNGGDLAFDGVKLFVASGLPTNDMIAAQKSNLFFGTSLLADWQEVKLLDMADLDGSKNVRVIMRMAAGCQIGIGADVVYYT